MQKTSFEPIRVVSGTGRRRRMPRRGELRLILLAALTVVVGGGIAIGYFGLPDKQPQPADPGMAASTQPSDPPGQPETQTAIAHGLLHYPLSVADISDGIEAPAIAVIDDGTLFLAWASEATPGERTIWLTSSTDNGESFAPARSVLTTGVFTAVSQMGERTMERKLRTLPLLAAHEDVLYLAWVAAGETEDTVAMMLAESHDHGGSFSEPVCVHQSTGARPTFTSLAAAADGTLVCSWLDNRHDVQQPFAAIRRPGETAFEPEEMVYAGPNNQGICPCCPTAALRTRSGETLVAFRGNEGGFRDMWIARRAELGFAPPVSPVNPRWEFSGCPHDGPSLAETSRGVMLAWMDASSGAERVYFKPLLSDQGAPPLTFASTSASTQGHPHLVARKEVLLAAWDESLPVPPNVERTQGAGTSASQEVAEDHTGHGGHDGHAKPLDPGGRAIFVAQSMDGGATFGPAVPLAPRSGAFQTRPKLALSAGGRLFAAWMELGPEGKSVVIGTVNLDAVSPARVSVTRSLP